MIVTFLLTGARLREIVQLDRGDIDLSQGTIRLHRKCGEVNILPLADSAKTELKAYLKQRRKRSRARALFISCRNLLHPAVKPRRESQSHSESYEPQESCYDGPVSAFQKPRVGKSRERSEVAGRIK